MPAKKKPHKKPQNKSASATVVDTKLEPIIADEKAVIMPEKIHAALINILKNSNNRKDIDIVLAYISQDPRNVNVNANAVSASTKIALIELSAWVLAPEIVQALLNNKHKQPISIGNKFNALTAAMRTLVRVEFDPFAFTTRDKNEILKSYYLIAETLFTSILQDFSSASVGQKADEEYDISFIIKKSCSFGCPNIIDLLIQKNSPLEHLAAAILGVKDGDKELIRATARAFFRNNPDGIALKTSEITLSNFQKEPRDKARAKLIRAILERLLKTDNSPQDLVQAYVQAKSEGKGLESDLGLATIISTRFTLDSLIFLFQQTILTKNINYFNDGLKLLARKNFSEEQRQELQEKLLLEVIECHLPIEFIKLLIAEKTNVNRPRCKNLTINPITGNFVGEWHLLPLIWATSHRNKDAAKLLLDSGAAIECVFMPGMQANNGMLPKEVAQKNHGPGNLTNGATPLITAATIGNVELVKLYLDYKADINARTHNGTTALFAAAQFDHFEIVELLLKANANIYAIDYRCNLTARQIAIEYGHIKIATLLHAAELRQAIIFGLDRQITFQHDQQITRLVNCLVELKAEINLSNDCINISVANFKFSVPNNLTKTQFSFNIEHLKKIIGKLPANNKDLPRFIYDTLLPGHTTADEKSDSAVSDSKKQTKLATQLKTCKDKTTEHIAELESHVTYLQHNTPTRAPERWKLTGEELQKKVRLIKKFTDLCVNDDDIKNENSVVLQERLISLENYSSALNLLKQKFAKKRERIEHEKNRKPTAIQTHDTVSKPNKKIVQDSLVADLKTVSAPAAKAPATHPAVKLAAKKPLAATAHTYAETVHQPKPRARTFTFVTQFSTLFKCYSRDQQLLNEILALEIKSNNWAVHMTINNALLGLCARVAERKGLQRERNALFHHHDLLPTPGNHDLRYYRALTIDLIALAKDLLNGTATSKLITKINGDISPDTLPRCIAQLNYGREELQAYKGIDPDLFSAEVLLAARGFTAARFSTYVMPLIEAKQLGELTVVGYADICALIKQAKPYIKVGGDFRHGKLLASLAMPGVVDKKSTSDRKDHKTPYVRSPEDATTNAAAGSAPSATPKPVSTVPQFTH